MKNFTIAIALLLVLASFTTNLTNTSSTVLADYEGTLLESAPVLENNDGDVKVTLLLTKMFWYLLHLLEVPMKYF